MARIRHENAADLHGEFQQFTDAFLEMSVLIADHNGNNSFTGNLTLDLYWRHLERLVAQLEDLLIDLTGSENATDNGAAVSVDSSQLALEAH